MNPASENYRYYVTFGIVLFHTCPKSSKFILSKSLVNAQTEQMHAVLVISLFIILVE
jgi:hypothetical protein